jgi:hypothetical protein
MNSNDHESSYAAAWKHSGDVASLPKFKGNLKENIFQEKRLLAQCACSTAKDIVGYFGKMYIICMMYGFTILGCSAIMEVICVSEMPSIYNNNRTMY